MHTSVWEGGNERGWSSWGSDRSMGRGQQQKAFSPLCFTSEAHKHDMRGRRQQLLLLSNLASIFTDFSEDDASLPTDAADVCRHGGCAPEGGQGAEWWVRCCSSDSEVLSDVRLCSQRGFMFLQMLFCVSCLVLVCIDVLSCVLWRSFILSIRPLERHPRSFSHLVLDIFCCSFRCFFSFLHVVSHVPFGAFRRLLFHP